MIAAGGRMSDTTGRQIYVPGMTYAPTNEQGVVFLFGRLAPRLGFAVETVQTRCPDCTARRQGKRVKIEFECWASDYQAHGHDPKMADIIVCWENDWESRPRRYRHIEVIDLKRYAGALPRVFVCGCSDKENAKWLRFQRIEWNVPKTTQVGDLVLVYRSIETHALHDAWEVVGPFTRYKKHNHAGRWPGLHTGLRCIARFPHLVTYGKLANDPVTRDLKVVKAKFMGKRDVTEEWPQLYEKIVKLNPQAKKSLAKYRGDL